MAQLDMPLAEMRSYRPELAVPADLDQFWSATLEEALAHDLGARLIEAKALLVQAEALPRLDSYPEAKEAAERSAALANDLGDRLIDKVVDDNVGDQ